MNVFIIGNVITFSTTFVDFNHVPINPVSVELTIRPMSFGLPDEDPILITMTATGTVWSADWDTGGMQAGTVYWKIQSTTPNAADQGTFELVANWANVAA